MIQLRRQVDLAEFNTLKIKARAAWFCEISSEAELQFLLQSHRDQLSCGLLVLGSGSNIVLTGDFPGLVLLNKICGIERVQEDSTSVLVKVGAGESWDEFVAYSVQQGWSGLENLSAIPGTMGAAPIQNIGAYGVELKDLLVSVSSVEVDTQQAREFDLQDCEFGYRDSVFKHTQKNRQIITAVTLRLNKRPQFHLDYGEIRKEMAARNLDEDKLSPLQLRELIKAIRARKLPDPRNIPNVGSFFKNPIVGNNQWQSISNRYPDVVSYPVDETHTKLAAGWLIDKLGWKGKSRGGASVHKQQALVLTLENGKCIELIELAHSIQADVLQHFGVELEIEPNFI